MGGPLRLHRPPPSGGVRGGDLPPPGGPLLRADNSRVSGLELLNVGAFRDLLAGQVLPPHESLQVRRVTVLFSDLRGSTALYAQRGDAPAYTLVREHFDVLFAAVRREQ